MRYTRAHASVCTCARFATDTRTRYTRVSSRRRVEERMEGGKPENRMYIWEQIQFE